MDAPKLIDLTMPFTIEDRAKSWYFLLSTLVLTMVAYAGTFLLTGVLRGAASVIASLCMVRLFVIYHDYQHGAILRQSKVADVFMTFFGIVALAPRSIWNESHNHHHRHNSKFSTFVVGSFPVVSAADFKGMKRSGKLKYKVIRHPLMIAFAYIPIFLVSFCLWPFAENPRKYADCGLSVIVHSLIAFALYQWGGWSSVLYTLVIPCLIMYALGGYLFYAQHNFPAADLRDDDHWEYFEAALHSSSHIRMGLIMNWVTANIGYHHIHHVNERIPFYRLPEVMDRIEAMQNPRTTSLHPLEIARCLRLKLWDEQKGKLISFSEFQSQFLFPGNQ
jgi:omega-6 fatty acid desaturase (delta-12 desaturase)